MDTKVRHLTDAQICKSELRASDYIGLLGGDEFTVMLPETPPATAFEVAERLRKLLEAIRASASPDVAAQNAIPTFSRAREIRRHNRVSAAGQSYPGALRAFFGIRTGHCTMRSSSSSSRTASSSAPTLPFTEMPAVWTVSGSPETSGCHQ
jgi:GGDEF domain-containing protein